MSLFQEHCKRECPLCRDAASPYDRHEGFAGATWRHHWANDMAVACAVQQSEVEWLEAELAKRQREHDLVRYARHLLHEHKLITNEELAELVAETGAVQRLHSYDEVQAELLRAREVLSEAACWIPDGSRRTPEERGAKLETADEVRAAIDDGFEVAASAIVQCPRCGFSWRSPHGRRVHCCAQRQAGRRLGRVAL